MDLLLSGIDQSNNCAANNNVAGTDDRSGVDIDNCNNGILASGAFPDIQCMEFTSQDCACYDTDIGPPEPSTVEKFPPITDCSLNECEEKVLEVCGQSMDRYGRLMSCVVAAIKREPECEAAIALGNGNGIGHIISDDTMYWRANKISTRRRRRASTTNGLLRTTRNLMPMSTCGDSAIANCGGSCISPGTATSDEWFGCLYSSIYDGALLECAASGDGTQLDEEDEVLMVDEAAWDLVGTKCGFYD